MFNNIVQKRTKNQYLKLIGIDQWELRETPETAAVANTAKSDLEIVSEKNLEIVSEKNLNQENESRIARAEAAIQKSEISNQSFVQQPQQHRIDQGLDQGISTQVSAQPSDANKAVLNDKENEVAATLDISKTIDLDGISTLQQLNETISNCLKCEISSNKTDTKFGIGNDQADLMIIGIAPDAAEHTQEGGLTGKTGQLLDNLLRSINLKRSQVFISNVVNCKPADHNKPQISEITSCIPFIKKQIELIQPKVILALGELSTQNLLGCDTPLSQLRGQPHDYGSMCIPLLATFHPEYLLRSPVDKAKSWDDIKFVRFLLSQTD